MEPNISLIRHYEHYFKMYVRSTRFRTGIYLIRCIPNDKVYIGSTTASFEHRWRHHISVLAKNQHDNYYLQNDYNKFGWEQFEFVIIEFINKIQADKYFLTQESFWIGTFQANNRDFGYNIGKIDIDTGRLRLAEETKAKLRLNKWSEEHRQRQSRLMTGRKRSKESIEQAKKTMIANGGYSKSDKTKQKMSEIMKNRHIKDKGIRENCATLFSKTYRITYPDGNQELITNLRKFCKENSLDRATILKRIRRGPNRTYHGMVFERGQMVEGVFVPKIIQEKTREINFFGYFTKTPDNNEVYFKNMTEFCKINNINRGNLWNTLVGRQKHEKGFVLTRKATREEMFAENVKKTIDVGL